MLLAAPTPANHSQRVLEDLARLDLPASGSGPEAILEQVNQRMKQLSALRDSLATSSAVKAAPGRIPFAPLVAAEILPPGVKVPFLEHYDGSTDPEDHLA